MSYEKSIADLLALADRIDHEELWRRPGLEHRDWPQEKQDRLMAGVNLRRYARKLQEKEDAAAPGRVYMRGFKLERVSGNYPRDRGCGDHEWHAAINRFANDEVHFPKPGDGRSKEWPRVMYTAKMVSDEVPRMILLFEQERRGLPTSYKMCGHDPSPATPLPDNHLRCHLGQQCRKCPYLQAIEAAPDMTNEAKDEAKAWTCATHILLESKPDTYFEGFLHDKSDDAFHARMARSFMDAEPPEPPLSPADDSGVMASEAPTPTMRAAQAVADAGGVDEWLADPANKPTPPAGVTVRPNWRRVVGEPEPVIPPANPDLQPGGKHDSGAARLDGSQHG